MIIRGGRVVDGTGRPAFVADVEVIGDRIGRIRPADGGGEPLDAPAGTVEIDASGLVVTPGFIDVHTHDDFAVHLDPDMSFKVLAGVTTSIVGNCGEGPVPVPEANRHVESQYPGAVLPPWTTYGAYFDRLRAEPPSLNVAALVGHGTVRAAIVNGDRPATRREARMVRRVVERGLDDGAIGASFGLFYEPGRSADDHELREVGRAVAERSGVLAVHLRDEADRVEESVREMLDLADATGVRLQLSHHKAAGRANHGRVAATLSMIDAARRRGVAVACDAYPYTAGSTVLADVLNDPAGVGGFDSAAIVICQTTDDTLTGLSLDEYGQRLGASALAAAEQLVAAAPATTVVLHSMAEADVRTVLGWAHTMIGSDGLPSAAGASHPRLSGTFARVLGHYVRDEGVLSLEDAVHRMTGAPAKWFGLGDRGAIESGQVADLVLLSPDRIADAGSFETLSRPPVGIDHVVVNGEIVVKGGRHVGSRPGRVLRR